MSDQKIAARYSKKAEKEVERAEAFIRQQYAKLKKPSEQEEK